MLTSLPVPKYIPTGRGKCYFFKFQHNFKGKQGEKKHTILNQLALKLEIKVFDLTFKMG